MDEFEDKEIEGLEEVDEMKTTDGMRVVVRDHMTKELKEVQKLVLDAEENIMIIEI